MDTIDQTLAALANPTRRQIVGHLASGSTTVNELVECFELTQPTISSHLKVLEEAGLISRARVAQTRPCRLRPGALDGLGAWVGELRSTYRDNYERLDGVLSSLMAQEEESVP